MELDEILKQTKSLIQEYAGEDPDTLFYANRFIFQRIQLLERHEKYKLKKQLLVSGAKCHGCDGVVEPSQIIAVHRIDGNRGYNKGNCVLMHQECHQKFHSENPSGKGGRNSQKMRFDQSSMKILTKTSKKHDGREFLYWWDITPNGAESLLQYDLIEFIKKDTGEHCRLPPAAIIGFLTKDRQTSRKGGPWGIKVKREREHEIAFEPGKIGERWLFLPVYWQV